jgi:hypothetical protein
MLALRAGRYDDSTEILSRVLAQGSPRDRLLAGFDLISINCLRDASGEPADLSRAVAGAQPEVTLAETHVIDLLIRVSDQNQCGNITDRDIADSIMQLVAAASSQPDRATPKWQLRHAAALVNARAGRWKEAQTQAEQAWQPGADLVVGAQLVRIYVKNGAYPAAERILLQMTQRVRPHDAVGQAELAEIQTLLSNRRAGHWPKSPGE